MKEIHLWNFILTKLNNNNKIIITVVLHSEKGSPGKEGFKMAVSSDGEQFGSIGGGIMEYNISEKCRNFLKNDIKVKKLETLHHNKKSSANRSGLICSGSQTNFTISLGKTNIPVIKKIVHSLKEHKYCKIIIGQKGISLSTERISSKQISFNYKNENNWNYEQTLCKNNIVHIFGGGHVGLAVSKILSMLDFYIYIHDIRDDLQTLNDNLFADKKITGTARNSVKFIGKGSYVVIVTTGIESDKEVIKLVINKNVKYIGLMGTKVKIKKIFNEAVKEGVRKELLKKIHAPIGIDINSNTPEEIAVSIAAEIIKIKNEAFNQIIL